jgi:hypothetical protein
MASGASSAWHSVQDLPAAVPEAGGKDAAQLDLATKTPTPKLSKESPEAKTPSRQEADRLVNAGAGRSPTAWHAMPVGTSKDGAKGDSAMAPSAPMLPNESPEAKAPSRRVPDNFVDTATGGSSNAWPAMQGLSADIACGSMEGPTSTKILTNDGPARLRRNQPEVKSASPEPLDPDHVSSQRSQAGDKSDVTSTPQTGSKDTGKKESAVSVGQPIEHAQVARAESGRLPGNAGLNAPFSASPKDDSPAAVRMPDQATSKASSSRQDQAAETPQKPPESSHQARRESQEIASSKRDDTPVHQHRPTETMGLDDKKAGLELGTDGVKGPTGTPVSTISAPTAVTPHSSAEAALPRIVDPGTGSSGAQTVHEQVLEGVRAAVAQGDGQISVRLQPPELGAVTIRLREHGTRLEGTLQVDRSDTRREIERALPEVVRSLQDAGVQVHKLDVIGADASVAKDRHWDPDWSGSNSGRGAWQQEGGSGQSSSGQSRDHLPASYTSGAQEAAQYSRRSEETAKAGSSIRVPPGRIDVLL